MKKKFQAWMVVVPGVVIVGAFLFLRRTSVELGGECLNPNECKRPAELCLSMVGTGKSICTESCGSAGCPDGLVCQQMDVEFGSVTRRSRGSYCVPKSMAH